jgi:diguanylate cyclase (GGDEF)-like protein/PAS domain S-box-containing protein
VSRADIAERGVPEILEDPARHAALFNAFPSLVWIADAAGRVTFVNQAWEDYTGRSVESEQGAKWLESVHPGDRPELERLWKEALGLRSSFNAEYRLRRADGQYGWIQHAAVPVHSEGGRLAGFLATCHDITERRDAELSARENERRIRMIADNVPVRIAYYDGPTLTCRFSNRAYAQTFGFTEESILGRTVPEVIGAEGYRQIEPYIERVMKGESVVYERSVRDASGAERVLEVTLIPQRGASGDSVAAFAHISDITRHRQAEQVVRESEERLRKFADATDEGIAFQEGGILVDCNQAVLRMTGYTYDEIVGTEIISYVAPDCREDVLEKVRTGYESPYESALLHKDGRRIPVEFAGRVMPFKGKNYRMSVVRDIRQRKEAEARIQFLAHHDTLTGLPNRALLMDRLEFILASARRHGSQVAILFIDLDNFKTVNDSLGHAAGDQLLRIIARRIQESLRSADVVSRLGGDEFLVVLPELESEHAPVQVAEKLLPAVSETVSLEGQSLTVSPSIGISLFPRDGATADALIKNADAAMYLAKERGRSNYQFFNERLSQAAFRALQLETRMRQAIREQSFELHYQPQVRVDDGSVTGMEALIRWRQEDGSWLPPNEFIPVAEQRGLIMPIGSWVLRGACRQNREWQLAGLPSLPVAVNLSAIQFKQRNLVDEVERSLAESGLEARFLEFELTESMLMEDVTAIARTLESLKALGVRIAIDDFGTGHSSLMHLKRFPIDKLKIDRTFVRDVPVDADDVAITAAIIDLARNMSITSIAEGVERSEQLAYLRNRGCQEMQGYLVSRALPPREMAAWLAGHRVRSPAAAGTRQRT